MRATRIQGVAVILIKSTDLPRLVPREVNLIRKALTGSTITKRDVNMAFAGIDHVIYLEEPPVRTTPTTPLEIEHQDIRSERPCT